MENLYNYCLIFFCCLLFLLYKLSISNKKFKNLPPSPNGLPIIGHLHLIKKELYEDLASLSSKYGPVFSLKFGCRSFVVVSSPSAIEDCFAKNDIILANRPRIMAADRFSYNYVTIGVAPYGHLWRVLRRLAVVESLSNHSLQKSSAIREEEIQMILRSIFRVSQNGTQKVDLNYWISVYTLNIVTRMATGRCSIKEQDVGNELGKTRIEESKKMFGSGITLTMCDFFPILRWIGFKGMEKGMISLHKNRDAFLQSLVDEVRQEKKSGFSGMHKEEKEALLKTLLSHQEAEPDFLSDDIIKSIILIMFTAGRETSILTIEWALSLLLSHPKEMQKLRTEIDNVVGHERFLEESDLPKLPYLRCVINETMRLYPAAPLLLPHYASQDCKIQGYDIPEGTIVLANAWGVHRDPKLWEEPEKFTPERFEAKILGEKDEINFKFLPFGIGRRACPGANLGIRNVSLAVGALVQCFYLAKVADEDEDMEASFKNRITLLKAKPLEAMSSPRPELIQLLSQSR
ncbi:OLC1v1016908C1 [Oldenlandia corymbosa var. corymbosa]|uniref:OLC1v1016908C1 n=1 Tax=Oldenlandia corymbosa var. corymbosa TaxID=529605 RepID=A0AAV1E878_OLDCO|nr:OLC1v1016908C1 [Oldenlandia corymbosa var. corymbosa]